MGRLQGELDIGGCRIAGYIARAFRGEAPIGKNGRSIVVNLGRPKMLLWAIMQATYKPVMQAPYDAAVKAAGARIPALMEDELKDAIEYRASRGTATRTTLTVTVERALISAAGMLGGYASAPAAIVSIIAFEAYL